MGERTSTSRMRPHVLVIDPTAKELDVLRCLSHGMTVGMAAEALGVSYETAKWRLGKVRLKLAAKNQAHAICIALRRGLIT